jgi:hypothetical protein
MSKGTEISLLNFFVFNPTFGQKEGEEHKKLLYYHPSSAALDTKIKHIGLSEAIVRFIETFTDSPCESLHTQKTRQLFYQAEKDYWMVMTVNIPKIEKPSDNHGSSYEYLEEDVQDQTYQAVLEKSYNIFRLFNGSISLILKKMDVQGLRQRLEHFFNKYLATIHFNQANILDVFSGIQFLPLDRSTYLRIQCFVNQLEASIPQIRYSVFLYNGQLVWSGLEQEDMRILYSYLTTSLFPAANEQDFQSTAPSVSITSPDGPHVGRFLLGPPNLNDETNIGRIPRIHLYNLAEIEECHLVVYRVLGATLCLLLNGDFQINFEFMKKLDKLFRVQLEILATDIAEHCTRKTPSASEPQFKYIYFNRMNLAQKSSIHMSDGTSPSVSPDVMRVISDLHHDLNVVTDVDDGETVVKMATDCWVIGKKSDQREVYIVVNQKNANLIEINEEVKRLCASNFNNIFFLD